MNSNARTVSLPFWGALVAAILLPFTASAAELKPPCRGLMLREYHGQPLPSFMDSFVVQVHWKDLEPADQHFKGPAWDLVEKARANPGAKIRLRILCGIHSPNFVKQLGGAGVSDPIYGIDTSATGGLAVFNRHDKRGGSIPRFWITEVLDQYEQLMAEVARRYENTPEICEIVASGAMTVYAEPFYRAHGEKGTNERLFKAGLNFQKDKAAHTRVVQIHERLFRKTRTSLAVNPWDVIDDSPDHVRTDFKPTAELVSWARTLMGDRLVLQNNGTGTDAGCPERGTPASSHFCYLASIEGPKGFQTRTLQRLGGTGQGLFKTLDAALKMGANFVELPAGFQKCDQARLKEYDRKLRQTR